MWIYVYNAPNLNCVGWVEEWFHAISSGMMGWRVTPKQSILSPNLGRLPSGIKHGWLANPTNWMEVVMGKSSTNGDFLLQCLIAGGYTLIYLSRWSVLSFILLRLPICTSSFELLMIMCLLIIYACLYIYTSNIIKLDIHIYIHIYTYIYICNNNDRACSQIFVSSSSLISLKYTWISFIFCFTF